MAAAAGITPWQEWDDDSADFMRVGHFSDHDEARYGLVEAIKISGVAVNGAEAHRFAEAAQLEDGWLGINANDDLARVDDVGYAASGDLYAAVMPCVWAVLESTP